MTMGLTPTPRTCEPGDIDTVLRVMRTHGVLPHREVIEYCANEGLPLGVVNAAMAGLMEWGYVGRMGDIYFTV